MFTREINAAAEPAILAVARRHQETDAVEQRQQVRRVAEIRVHDANDVGDGEREAVQNSAPQPELARPMDHANASASRPLLGAVAGSIARVVVDDDHLDIHPVGVGDVKDPLEELVQAVALVVGRNDERQIWTRHCEPPVGGVASVRFNS